MRRDEKKKGGEEKSNNFFLGFLVVYSNETSKSYKKRFRVCTLHLLFRILPFVAVFL